MASGTQAEIEVLANSLKFSDIFEYKKLDVNATTPASYCPEGFKSINAGSQGAECLKLKVRTACASDQSA